MPVSMSVPVYLYAGMQLTWNTVVTCNTANTQRLDFTRTQSAVERQVYLCLYFRVSLSLSLSLSLPLCLCRCCVSVSISVSVSVSFPVFVSIFVSICVSVSVSVSVSISFSISFSLSLSLPLSLSLLSQSLPLPPPVPVPVPVPLPLLFSLTLSPAYAFVCSLSHAFFFSHARALSSRCSQLHTSDTTHTTLSHTHLTHHTHHTYTFGTHLVRFLPYIHLLLKNTFTLLLMLTHRTHSLPHPPPTPAHTPFPPDARAGMVSKGGRASRRATASSAQDTRSSVDALQTGCCPAQVCILCTYV